MDIQNGIRFDTGNRYIDANGIAHVIYGKYMELGFLGSNTAPKIVPHNEPVVMDKYCFVKFIMFGGASTPIYEYNEQWMINGIQITPTDVVIIPVDDLSAMKGNIYFEFCLT